MRNTWIAFGVAVALVGTSVATAQQAPRGTAPIGKAPADKTTKKTDAKAPPADPARTADEQAVRQVADAYVAAYNKHDAQAIANLFTPDGEIVDDAGDAQRGRAKIQATFAAIFEEFPQATASISISGVRLLNPGIAIEDGTTQVVLAPGAPSEQNRYTVVHIKQGGRWLMASARDLPEEQATPAAKLEPLAWLVGDWVDESQHALIATTYRWDEKHAFLLSDFTIHIAGKPQMSGTQRIGWDPLAKVIRSWIFDSGGGFSEGTYSQDGKSWIVKLNGVTHDGEPTSATNVLTPLGKDRLSWQSRDRMLGGTATPDVEQVIVVRKPPEPK